MLVLAIPSHAVALTLSVVGRLIPTCPVFSFPSDDVLEIEAASALLVAFAGVGSVTLGLTLPGLDLGVRLLFNSRNPSSSR